MSKIKKGLGYIGSLAVALLLGSSVYAADASSTLATLMDSIISTSVNFATIIITTYWPYVIVFGILSAMIALFMRFAHLGSGRHK